MPSDQRLNYIEHLFAKNASAERRLNHYLKYVDRLKRTFERRSDQERMLFAVQHWTVQKPTRPTSTAVTQSELPRPTECSQSSRNGDSSAKDDDSEKTDGELSCSKTTPVVNVRKVVPSAKHWLLSLRCELPFQTAPKKGADSGSQQDDTMKHLDQGRGNSHLSAECLGSGSNVVGRERAELPRLCPTIDFTEYLSKSGNPRSIRELTYNKGSSSVEKWKSMAASIDPSKPVKKKVSDIRYPSCNVSVTRSSDYKLDGDGVLYSSTSPSAGGRMVLALRGKSKAEGHLCSRTWVNPGQAVQSDMPQVVSNYGSREKDKLLKEFDTLDRSQGQVGRSAGTRDPQTERLHPGCLPLPCQKDVRFRSQFEGKASRDQGKSPNDNSIHLPADREKNLQGPWNEGDLTVPDAALPPVASSGSEAEPIYPAREKALQTMVIARWKARKMELKDSKKRLFLIGGAENAPASNCTLIKFMSKTAQASHIKTAQWTMRYELAGL